MTNRSRILYLTLAVIFLFACNMPAGQPPVQVVTATQDLILTITAQAQVIQGGSQSAPPAAQDTPALPPPPEATPTITQTPTPSIPTVTVSKNTNCRTGPGKSYEITDSLVVGQSAQVVGKNTATNYWIIKRLSGSGECWLWGEYATVSGDVSGLKEYAIPATPTPTIPKPVTNLSDNKICFFDGVNYQLGGFITWQDKSDNEDGFKIFFNGNPHGNAPADATTFAIPSIFLVPGGSVSMGVQAYNSAGKAPLKEITITCP
ncbi:MAG TPA: hypothetical protein PKL78_09040 [Anaerolineales bacterium]|nr:hypothetical protein [Anaerolineales bacterium]